jgi:hypothetical protein
VTRLLLLLSFWFTVSCAPTFVEQRDVSKEGRIAATHSWTEVYDVYRQLQPNIDGVVAGAFSERIASLLANEWERLGDLHAITVRDPDFKDFVLRNLDDAISRDDAEKILNKAKGSCAVLLSSLCTEIEHALQ